MKQSHYDVLIIGAGMSGLAAGIRLAYYGKRVCIVEKHDMPGGLNSFYRIGKRDFDVGLHAMTNYAPKGDKHWPLNKVLRQLRIKPDEFDLSPQRESDVRFPGKRIRFNNDLSFFIASVAEQFPSQADGFRRLTEAIPPYEKLGTGAMPGSARSFLRDHISDAVLIDMLMCPVMYYGSATPDDMDFEQFCIMFRSLFFEGFAIRRLLILRFPFLAECVLILRVENVDAELGGSLERLRNIGILVANLTLDAIGADEHDLLHLPRIHNLNELRILDLAILPRGEVDDRENGRHDEDDPLRRRCGQVGEDSNWKCEGCHEHVAAMVRPSARRGKRDGPAVVELAAFQPHSRRETPPVLPPRANPCRSRDPPCR